MKWIVLLFVLVMVASLAIGCGSGNGNGNGNDNGAPEVVPGPSFTHGTEGPFETCTNCHAADIAEDHEGFENWEARCLECHEAL